MPIHEKLHWTLVIVCHPSSPEPFILHLDPDWASASSSGHTTGERYDSARHNATTLTSRRRADAVCAPLLSYLTDSIHLRPPAPPGVALPSTFQDGFKLTLGSLAVPQQTNGSDCGAFVLTYVEVRRRVWVWPASALA